MLTLEKRNTIIKTVKEQETLKRKGKITVKYFKDVRNLEELRKQYKKLAHKFHPDCGGNAEDFKAMTEEYEAFFKKLEHDSFFTDFEDFQKTENKYNAAEDKELREALNKIIFMSGIEIEIIGSWIWVSGSTYSVKDILKDAGYKFAGNKKMWYWHSGEYRKKSRKKMTIDAIRDTFGSVRVNTVVAPQLA